MNIKDAYIHNGDAILKDIKVENSALKKILAGKKADDTYLGWETVCDLAEIKPNAAGTADKVGHKLTFSGGVTGTWDGSADKTVSIPTKSSWNYDDVYLKLSGGTITGPIKFSNSANSNLSNNYLSAGGGYSPNSGRLGLKLVSIDQSDIQAGIGVDLTGFTYETTISTGRRNDTTPSYITFATHNSESSSYKRLGYFKASGDTDPSVLFHVGGTVEASKFIGSLQGNASTATNADTLDGVHYQNILERQGSGHSESGTATGWFRIAETLNIDATGTTFLLAIQRNYSYANNESYLFSISISYNEGISITQLSGYANSRLITKIRIDWSPSKIAYVDLYINASYTNNGYYWYTVGCAKSYTAWTANPTLLGNAYEFTTVQGCKSDRGFTGDLTGNATSATKLTNSRTIWGQSFDGTENVSGALTEVTDITASGNINCANLKIPSDGKIYNGGYYGLYVNSSAGDYGSAIYLTHDHGKNQTAFRIHSHYDSNLGGLTIGFSTTTQNYGSSPINATYDDILHIRGNGNIGIGTTSPSYKLHVVGDIYTTTGFKKKDSSDSYVLLGGGGHKLINSFSMAHDHPYLPLSGGTMSNTNVVTNLNADLLDGYHAGVTNGSVGIFVPWPNATTLKNEGLMPSEYGTSEFGYPDDVYLQSICKWAIAHYTSLGDITLIGAIAPNSSGTCILHLYSSSGKDSSTLLPRYCSGTYTILSGYIYNFGTVDYNWYYRKVSAGYASSAGSATTSTYASNVGSAGTAGTNYVTAANVISMYNWYNSITATDEASNTAIDKWNEIVSFLTGITDTSTLSGILAGYAAAGHNHDGRYIKWGGSAADTTAMAWGTLTAANGYTILSHASSSDGGDWGMVNQGGKIYMQLDGYYYQNEGQYRVTDVSETVTALGTNGNYLTWTKNGSTSNIIIPYATKADNADTVDGYHVSDNYNLLYKNVTNLTCILSSITTDYWYVKILIQSSYQSIVNQKMYLIASYSNLMTKAELQVYGYYLGYKYTASTYNEDTITGIASTRQDASQVIWLRMKKPIQYEGVTPNGNISIYSNYIASAEVITSAPSGVIFTDTLQSDGQHILSGDIKAENFKKNGSSDNYVLLGGGGHKALTDFSMSHSHPYLPLSGGTMSNTNVVTNLNADLLDGKHATNFLAWSSMQNIGNSSPFQDAVNFFNNLDNLNNGGKLVYNHAGAEYTELFTRRNDSTAHGTILKWGYTDNYIRIIRIIFGKAQSTDWEKISAGYADTAGSVAWDNVTGKPINFKAYSGSLSSGGWKIMQGKDSSPSIAISYNNSSAPWNSCTYSASMVWGCSDTRGLLDCGYNTPIVTFGGCYYGGSDDNNPTWYMKISGTNGTTYNLNSMPYAVSAGSVERATFGDMYNGPQDANAMTSNGLYYYSSNGPTTNAHNFEANDAAMYVQAYNSYWVSQIAQDYRSGKLAVRSRNNGTWQPWRRIAFADSDYVVSADKIHYEPEHRKFTRTASGNSWDTQAYSVCGYKECRVTYKISQTGAYIMVGLNSDPTTDASYQSIDYCWYTQSGGSLSMYENGTSIGSISGHTTYAVGDELIVEYSCGQVRYYHNGVLCRTVARTYGSPLYFDSSFHNAGSIENVVFEPIHDSLDFVQTTASYSLSNAAWTNTITLPTTAGSYILNIVSGNSTLTGVFSIGASDNAKDEISLHLHGNGPRLYARTNGTTLQLSSNDASAPSRSVTIKYRRII